MNKLKAVILTVLLACVPHAAIPQAITTAKVMTAHLPCNLRPVVVRTFPEKHKQQGFAQGLGEMVVDTPSASQGLAKQAGIFELYVNMETNTFTVLLNVVNDGKTFSCVVMTGTRFDQFDPKTGADSLNKPKGLAI